MDATWINSELAIKHLGFENPPKYIFISRSNQILRKAWDADVWHWPYDEPKPTWEELVEAERLAMLDRLKTDAASTLVRFAQQRIDAVCKNELGLTLPGQHTAEQIAECGRLHVRVTEIHAEIMAAENEAAVLAIDLRDDVLWQRQDDGTGGGDEAGET